MQQLQTSLGKKGTPSRTRSAALESCEKPFMICGVILCTYAELHIMQALDARWFHSKFWKLCKALTHKHGPGPCATEKVPLWCGGLMTSGGVGVQEGTQEPAGKAAQQAADDSPAG